MIKKINTKINKNILFLKTIDGETKNVIFDFPIRQLVQFENKLLVRIEPEIGKIFNENVFCYSNNGVLLWQVNSTNTIDEDCS